MFQRQGIEFAGLFYVHQLRLSVGQVIEELETAATALNPEEMENRIEFLPL